MNFRAINALFVSAYSLLVVLPTVAIAESSAAEAAAEGEFVLSLEIPEKWR